MKLHVGCGSVILPGWTNLDIEALPGVDLVDDIRSLRKIEDSSCEKIYACHVLEHVGRHEVQDVLTLWCKKLRPGGTLRLAVPDFEKALSWYKEHGHIPDILGLVAGGQKNSYDYHGMIFDKKFLSSLLENAGFTSIQPWEWRETDHADHDDYSQAYLPHMDKDHGLLVSLNIEATRA